MKSSFLNLTTLLLFSILTPLGLIAQDPCTGNYPSIDNIIISDTDCNFSTGGISIFATTGSGTTGSGTCSLEFSIDGGTTFSDISTFSNLDEGDYNVVVKECACETTETVSVGEKACVGVVGDYVWEDTNYDGQQSSGESGIAGVRVEIYSANDILHGIAYTNSMGYFLFSDILEGEYYLKYYFDDKYLITSINQGADDSKDNDIDHYNGPNTSQVFYLNGGESITSIDLGLYQCVQVGDLVWFDANMNDQWDSNENGLNGVRVEIFRHFADGPVLWDYVYTGHKPGTPSDDGYYNFCVPPGTYYIRINDNFPGLVRVVPGVGTESVDGDITDRNGEGTTDDFTLTSGNHRTNISAGYYPMATFGDRVWVDENNNGEQDSFEPKLGDVNLEVYKAVDHSLVTSTTTNNMGEYKFDYLLKEDYYVKVIPPTGYTVTDVFASNDDVDSDIDHSNGPNTSGIISLDPNEHLSNIDVGLVQSVLPIGLAGFSGENKNGKNELTWTIFDESEVSYFTVTRFDETSGVYLPIQTIESQDLYEYSIVDANIEVGQTYYYQLNATSLNNDIAYSNIVSITTKSFVSGNEVVIYPNPAKELVTIALDSHSNLQSVSMYNSIGKLVYSNEVDRLSTNVVINIAELTSGIYTIELNFGNIKELYKLVVID